MTNPRFTHEERSRIQEFCNHKAQEEGAMSECGTVRKLHEYCNNRAQEMRKQKEKELLDRLFEGFSRMKETRRPLNETGYLPNAPLKEENLLCWYQVEYADEFIKFSPIQGLNALLVVLHSDDEYTLMECALSASGARPVRYYEKIASKVAAYSIAELWFDEIMRRKFV